MLHFKNLLIGKSIALILFGFLLFVVIYKAIHIPITHDEKSASVYYPNFTVWQIMMYPDNWPSNHILNSLAIKASEAVFGISPWSVRLHSVLAFVFFFGIMYLLASRYFKSSWLLYCVPFFIMFCNPFLIDFYSLARGYGLSNALMAASVLSLLMFCNSGRWQWHYITIILAMLAAYANFTLLIYWLAVQILLVALVFIKPPGTSGKTLLHLTLTFVLAIAFLALCYTPLYKMQSTNQFVYWSKDSFFNDTMVDQISRFRYGLKYFGIPAEYVAVVVIGLLVTTGIYLFTLLKNGGLAMVTNPLFIVFCLLALVFIVNMVQVVCLGTPYLTTRTALSYYVLFAFVLMFAIGEAANANNVFRNFAVPVVLVLFTLHIIRTVNLKWVNEWRYDANTYQVLDYLQQYQQKHPELKTITLNTTWIFNPSFGFYCITGKTPWLNLTEWHSQVDSNSQTLFYYTENKDTAKLTGRYKTLIGYADCPSTLMIRRDADTAVTSK